MNTKLIGTLAVAAGIAVGGYWYYSPYLALKATQAAADAGDADAFNARVDYPKLRENFKGQMTAIALKSIGQAGGGSGSAAEAFGASLGLALANQMVEAFMRPEVVMNVMQARKLQSEQAGEGARPTAPGTTPNQAPDATREKGGTGEQGEKGEIEWTFERASVDRLIAYGREPGVGTDEPQPGFVFERSGFADWKLTEIRLVFE